MSRKNPLTEARRRLDTFQPRSSPCPLCGKGFRDGCGHGVVQAYDRLEADVRREEIRVSLEALKVDRR